MERRLAFGALLLFTAMLPVQVAVPGLGFGALSVLPGDVVLGLGLVASSVAVARGSIRPRFRPFGPWVGVYLLSILPAVALSESPARSALKWCALAMYAAMVLLVVNLVDTEAALRKAAVAWTVGTGVAIVMGLAAIVLFYLGSSSGVVARLTSDFGSLPAGHYPRVAALFHQRQPNLLCHYLSIGLILVCACGSIGWISRLLAAALGAGALVVGAFTFSLGIGGVALGLCWWLAWTPNLRIARPLRRAVLAFGVAIATAFAILMVVAPGSTLFSFRAQPSARVGCWQAAWAQLVAHPLTGRGLGLEPECPPYVVPSGITLRLVDSHNLYLSVASTQGVLGFLGFAGMVWAVLHRSLPLPRAPTPSSLLAGSLTIAFVQSWLYQGLAASYENTRAGWLLIGLLSAAQDLEEKGRGTPTDSQREGDGRA